MREPLCSNSSLILLNLSGMPKLDREWMMQHVRPWSMWQEICISLIDVLRRSCVNMEDVYRYLVSRWNSYIWVLKSCDQR